MLLVRSLSLKWLSGAVMTDGGKLLIRDDTAPKVFNLRWWREGGGGGPVKGDRGGVLLKLFPRNC